MGCSDAALVDTQCDSFPVGGRGSGMVGITTARGQAPGPRNVHLQAGLWLLAFEVKTRPTGLGLRTK